MRILYGMPRYGVLSQTFIGDLLFGLLDRGHVIHVVCNNQVGSWGDHENLSVTKARYTRSHWWDRAYRAWLVYIKGVDRRSLNFRLKEQRAREALTPVLAAESFDVAYFDFGKSAVVFDRVMKDYGIPYVAHFHGVDITSALSDKTYRNALESVFENAYMLIAASDHVRRLLVLAGAPQPKTRVVRLGYHIDGIEPLPWHVRRDNSPGIVFLGRMVAKKHPIALVEAFRIVAEKNPEAKLTLIGDGKELQDVRDRIARYSLESRVSVLGSMTRREALSIVNHHWVYAQHSVTSRDGDQEGFGVSLAESAALGLPVVSTFHNGIPEQVGDGETGFLVLEHDYESMAEKLLLLLSNPDLCEEMGARGQKRIAEICSTDRRILSIERILSSM